jgi:uncharacterized protein with PQ loop repeat
VSIRPITDRMLTFIAATATVSGVASAFLPSIQIGKMWRARSSAGISLPFIVGVLVNNAVWLVYAVAFSSAPLMASTSLGLLMNVSMVAVAFRFRPRPARLQLVRDTELAEAA